MKKFAIVSVLLAILGGCTYESDGRLTITNDSLISFAGSRTVITIVNETACNLQVINDNERVVAKVPPHGMASVRYGRLSASRRYDEFVLVAIAYAAGKPVGNQARAFRLNKRGGTRSKVWSIWRVDCPYRKH